MQAMGTVPTNKYAEGYPGKRYYGGCEVVDQTEQIAIDRLKKLFGLEWANVQPHSGAQANAAVMLGCINPGDKILGFDLSHGGHLTHGSPVNFSGKLYVPAFYGVEEKTGKIDFDKIEATAVKEKPKLIICGASSYSRDWDYKKLRKIADKVGALLMADISHPAGLIARGLLTDPLPHCHIVTTTTHKTLRGPRSGIIMMKEVHSKEVNSRIFPGIQGGPLMHIIAAKAVAFAEAMTPEFKAYAKAVQANARALAKSLQAEGLDIVSGGTDNHLMLVDLRPYQAKGKHAEKALDRAAITCNKNGIPFDPEKPFVTSGIRLGTPAGTTRGFGEAEFTQIGKLIAEVVDGLRKNGEMGDAQVEASVQARVEELCGHFPIYPGLGYAG